MPHPLSLSALLLAASSGLVALRRTLARSSRRHSWAEPTAPRPEEIMAYGCLPDRLKAGKPVRCVLSACPAPAQRGDTAIVRRFECEGVIVGLQPSPGRYGYQDVSVVIPRPDFAVSPLSRLVVESIG